MPAPESGTLVLWRRGDLLLALPLDTVEEVVSTSTSGPIKGRNGPVNLVDPWPDPGGQRPKQALIVTDGERRVALPADRVEGLVHQEGRPSLQPPTWLAHLRDPALNALVRVPDGRVAALLDPRTLFPEP
jgi:hypothetical protein